MNGNYLLVGYGYDDKGGYLTFDDLNKNRSERIKFHIFGENFTIKKSNLRYCIGRHDLITGHSIPCPNKRHLIDEKTDMCWECFNATGFNPAFYNSDYISPQQKAYNENPHIVYLVNFAYGYNKVGISNARRGIKRLLEQGARVGYILKRFENAEKARELEATISGHFHQIRENLRSSTKRKLILQPYDYEKNIQQLNNLIEKIENYTLIKFDKELINCEDYYLHNCSISNYLQDITDTTDTISGKCIGLVGDLMIIENNTINYMMSLKSVLGKTIEISSDITLYNKPLIQYKLF